MSFSRPISICLLFIHYARLYQTVRLGNFIKTKPNKFRTQKGFRFIKKRSPVDTPDRLDQVNNIRLLAKIKVFAYP